MVSRHGWRNLLLQYVTREDVLGASRALLAHSDTRSHTFSLALLPCRRHSNVRSGDRREFAIFPPPPVALLRASRDLQRRSRKRQAHAASPPCGVNAGRAESEARLTYRGPRGQD